MRILIVTVLLSAGLWACSEKKESQQGLSAEELVAGPSNGGKVPTITFSDSVFDFGIITAGTIVKHSFTFTNKGEGQLIISNAQASCGCTVPTFPRDPIAPGASGKIDVEFNSTGRSGNQNKTVTVLANTSPATTELQLVGKVQPNPETENGPVQ